MKFKDVSIGQVFFEDQTGEYYIKVSDTDSHVYDVSEDCVHMVGTEPITCIFPQDHEIDEIFK